MQLFKPSSLKVLALILAILAVLLLSACNKEDTDATDATDQQTEAPSETSKYNDGKLRIFADGKYQCKIVRPENATRRELDFYVSVRNIFKEVTGVMPSISTDFIAHNESYDPNEFAILVGTTDHDEASELYSKLSYSDFRAELINKKYVLGFHDLDTANAALASLKALLVKNFKNGELILEGDWNYSFSQKEILESIPVYEGGSFSDVYEGAYDMQTIVIENTNENEYNAYLNKIAADGFTPYTANSIGKNLFATYTSDKYILTTMYFASRNEVRVTLEESGNYDLPALEVENVYTDKGVEATITQIGLEESTGVQNGMSYIIKLADGSFMIFDGGTGAGTGKAQFFEIMESLADDPNNITVATWVITHAHGDHFGLLYSLIYNDKFLENYTVEQIIWSKVSEKQLANMEAGNMDYIDKLFATLKDTKIVIAHPGQVFYIRNAVYTVFATIEMVEPIILANLNDSSVVGRLEIAGRSILFPGDSHPTETEAITSIYKESLKSDAVQVIHHGYQGGNTSFYALVDPITVFWPLGMKNYSTAEAPNTPMKDWGFSEWFFMEESKVEKIYVAGSEVITLNVKDLPSHN